MLFLSLIFLFLMQHTHTHRQTHPQIKTHRYFPSISQFFPFVNITLSLPFIYSINWALLYAGHYAEYCGHKGKYYMLFAFKQNAIYWLRQAHNDMSWLGAVSEVSAKCKDKAELEG